MAVMSVTMHAARSLPPLPGPPPARRGRRFAGFLLVSAAAHLGVLCSPLTRVPAALPPAPQRLSVSLVAKAVTRPAAAPAATVSRSEGSPRRSAVRPGSLPGRSAEAAVPSPVVSAAAALPDATPLPAPVAELPATSKPLAPVTPPSEPVALAGKDPQLQVDYRQRVSDAVAAHRQYPTIARIRGWQGTALVEIRIGPQGKVMATRIARSSGHEVLDREAVDMVHKAEPLPSWPDPAHEQFVLLQLPVIFSLVN